MSWAVVETLQRCSVAGPLYHLIAVAVVAVPKMPALCQLQSFGLIGSRA